MLSELPLISRYSIIIPYGVDQDLFYLVRLPPKSFISIVDLNSDIYP